MRMQLARLLPIATVVVAAALITPAAAYAAAGVTASPSTVSAGERTTVRASCRSDASSAKLRGTWMHSLSRTAMAADTSQGPGSFIETVSIPAGTRPGTYDISVACSTGQGGMTKLTVASGRAPATGGGSTSTGVSGALLLTGLALLTIAVLYGLATRRRKTAPVS
jgi:hypothetical protein